jgi:hypothetical protein
MTGAHMEDRRAHPRFEAHYPVTVQTSRFTVQGETQNLSGGGAFICCQQPLAPGEVCNLKIEFSTLSPLRVNCRVVWSGTSESRDEDNPYRMGVCFQF